MTNHDALNALLAWIEEIGPDHLKDMLRFIEKTCDDEDVGTLCELLQDVVEE